MNEETITYMSSETTLEDIVKFAIDHLNLHQADTFDFDVYGNSSSGKIILHFRASLEIIGTRKDAH